LGEKSKGDFYLRLGDRLPNLSADLEGVTTEDLAGASAVLVLRDEADAETLLSGATIEADELTATYAWTAGDIDDDPAGVLAAAGYLTGFFRITFASGKQGSFGLFRILVSE
jgi:hypothetical protein